MEAIARLIYGKPLLALAIMVCAISLALFAPRQHPKPREVSPWATPAQIAAARAENAANGFEPDSAAGDNH